VERVDEAELELGVSPAGEPRVLVCRDEEAREMSMWTDRWSTFKAPMLCGVNPVGDEDESASEERRKEPDRRGRPTCTQSVTSSSCGLARRLGAPISICVHVPAPAPAPAPVAAAGSSSMLRSRSRFRSDAVKDAVDGAPYCALTNALSGGARCWSKAQAASVSERDGECGCVAKGLGDKYPTGLRANWESMVVIGPVSRPRGNWRSGHRTGGTCNRQEGVR
jgi:hypothetical protein